VPAVAKDVQRQPVRILLASGRDWFASAFRAVLEPEGFTFVRVRSGELALRDVGLIDPDVVIIDEGLPDLDAAGLCRELGNGKLSPSVPILVYSPDFWHETQQAEAMHAGAWDIIKEPVRSQLVTAKLRRLLEIKRLIQITEEGSLSDIDTGLYNLAGLMRALEILGSLARRNQTNLSCAVLGPTEPAAVADPATLRRRAAELCADNIRGSDVCAWLDGLDLTLVAYDASVAGTTLMVRRLLRILAEELESAATLSWSAGIVELPASGPAGRSSHVRSTAELGIESVPVADKIANLSRFAAAQTALRQAREAGGGIRIAALS
jgi:CheY-like chemotaxis protein